MPYFIRISDTDSIQQDIQRGFSSYMGEFDKEDVALSLDIDTTQDNWEDEFEDAVYGTDWYEGADGWWRTKHHDGLACHLIGDELDESNISKIMKQTVGCGSSHEAMHGNIRWVASINKQTHVFQADSYNLVGE